MKKNLAQYKLKSLFMMLYFLAMIIIAVHSGVMLFFEGLFSAWLGPFVCAASVMALFGYISKDTARTSNNLPLLLTSGVVGFVLSILLEGSIFPVLYAFELGILGNLLYVFWYSRLARDESQRLKAGNPLPDFSLTTPSGDILTSAAIRQAPAFIMFYRGNWCPLCTAQIREIAEDYREFERRGIRVLLVSPQPSEKSDEIAKRFDVPIEFLVDTNNAAARSLGIDHPYGVPPFISGYNPETVMPTVILTDANGTIVSSDLTDNYRVRPEPLTFLKKFDEIAGLGSPA